ncbi:MAG TPA: ABC transporter ATP-binding protein [Nitrososphaeraceae archaeon]|nr:ABC transporter ATP-binding protein [Nitrososphaeraceae archaeon]
MTIRAVDNVSFCLNAGESFGIAGESGCGKSTLASAILKNISYPGKIESGSIFFNDEDISKLSDKDFSLKIRWKKISMIFQGAMNSLDPVYKIKSQINGIFLAHREKENLEKILQIFKDFGLDKSILDKYPHELSGGMKQRIIIAMALLLDPEVIIADEPTTALDVLIQAQIINLLKKLKKEKQISIILISHDIPLIAQLVDKIGIMYAGELVEINSTKEIIFNPKHPYTKSLISQIPDIKAEFIVKKVNLNGDKLPILNDKINSNGCKYYSECEHAMKKCMNNPPDYKIGKDGYVKCWLYEE